ncbi:hypothetical protein GINT2_000774 [Glugoides intestinalis]
MDWAIQMMLGHNPPFLVKNLSKNTCYIHKRPLESECARFVIPESINNQFTGIKAFIRNGKINIPTVVKVGNELITHSCFDELHLFFYTFLKDKESYDKEISSITEKNTIVYYAKLSCCRNWGITSLKAVKIGILNDEKGEDVKPFINIPISISDLRSSNCYHYNVCQQEEESYYEVIFMQKRMQLPSFCCPICFLPFSNFSNLKKHITIIHLRYELNSITDIIEIKNRKEDPFLDYIELIEPAEEVAEESNYFFKGVEFYEAESIDEAEGDGNESIKNYIDFCSEISSGSKENCGEDKNTIADTGTAFILPEDRGEENGNNAILENKRVFTLKSRKKLAKIQYLSASTEKELVKLIFDTKAKKSNGLNVFLLQKKPLIKRKVEHSKFISTHRIYGCSKKTDNVSMYLSENYNCPSNSDFSFMKSRKCNIIEYQLRKYGLLIEYEFDTIDYSGMIAKHLNLRLKDHFLSKEISNNAYHLMKTWNRFSVRNKSFDEIITETIETHGLDNESLKLIELLYTRGILNSEEIMCILNKLRLE